MIRLLLVGCGKIGTAGHLPALKELADEGLVQVTACDADPAKAKAAGEKFGFPTATDWEAAADGVDAVAVCLPPGPNAEVAAAAAKRGLHVLCEKPPGRNISQAAALAASAAANPAAVTMVAFNRRFNDLYQRARGASDQLGPPTSFYGRFSRPGLGEAPDDTATDWILSSSAHALDLAVATMGYPSAVSVSRRLLGAGPDNAWTVHLHTAAGAAVLFLHYAAGQRVERYEWAGPGYDARLEFPGQAEWAQAGRKVETWPAPDKAYHRAYGFLGEYRAFVAAIAGDGPRPACDFGYARDFLRLVETIVAAPDGTLRELPIWESAPETGADSHTDGSAGRRRERPVVLLNHPVAAQGRFFAMDTLSTLRARCDVRQADDPKAWADAQAVVTGRGVKAPPDLAERAPNLELLVVIGASVRNLATPALLDRGVLVCNTADAVAQSVAEHCLMAALAGLRRLPQTDRAMRAGEWPRPGGGAKAPSRVDVRAHLRTLPFPPPVRTRLKAVESAVLGRLGRGGASGAGAQATGPGLGPASDLRGETVALIGWGHTARRFAELLAPFGCPVLVVSDAAAPEADLAALGARRAGLGEALAAAKVVSLHKGLTDATRGFLGANELAMLRPGTVLVNAARGELIDEAALLNRLAAGDIVAALDVYGEEPLPKAHPLRKAANVILTPHHASTTAQEERRMGEQALATVLAWADGLPIDALDQRRLARMT